MIDYVSDSSIFIHIIYDIKISVVNIQVHKYFEYYYSDIMIFLVLSRYETYFKIGNRMLNTIKLCLQLYS